MQNRPSLIRRKIQHFKRQTTQLKLPGVRSAPCMPVSPIKVQPLWLKAKFHATYHLSPFLANKHTQPARSHSQQLIQPRSII